MFVTWRLADSLPAEKLAAWYAQQRDWVAAHPRPWDPAIAAQYRQRFTASIEAWLDRGEGTCLLRDPVARKIVADAFAHFDHCRYELGDYVVMPNHVHVLVRVGPDRTLAGIVHTWKSYTASRINQQCGRRAAVWQHEYWDRIVRDACHFAACRRYIATNAAKAGLRATEFTVRIVG